MVERIEEMPEGTIGFRASGKVSGEDYREVMEPTLRARGRGGRGATSVRLDELAELSSGALTEDARTGLALGFGHHSAWKRTALVTDLEWVRRAFRLFSWLAPGESADLRAGRARGGQGLGLGLSADCGGPPREAHRPVLERAEAHRAQVERVVLAQFPRLLRALFRQVVERAQDVAGVEVEQRLLGDRRDR